MAQIIGGQMGLLDVFESKDPKKIQEKIKRLEKEKEKVIANPLHSKDDLIRFDVKIRALQEKLG